MATKEKDDVRIAAFQTRRILVVLTTCLLLVLFLTALSCWAVLSGSVVVNASILLQSVWLVASFSAVQAVAAFYVAAAFNRAFHNARSRRAAASGLAATENTVLGLILAGFSEAEIAARIGRTRRTVQHIVRRLQRRYPAI